MNDLKPLRRLSLFVLLAVFTFSCGQPPATNTSNSDSKFPTRVAGTQGGTLSYRLTAPPTTFNYLVADSEQSVLIALYMMNSRPIEFDHATQKYRNALAESWTLSADRKTVDMKLREGLKFSDGKPLTTEDLAFTLAAMYDDRTKAAAWKDSMMVNGKPIETKIVDARNMQFVFPEPVAAIENYIDNLGVLPKHVLGADFEAGKLAESWKVTADPATIVTSGPFSVEVSTAGERIVLKRNPNFWRKDEKGTQMPYLDKIAFEIISDSNQALVRLNQNSIDILDRIRGADYASLLNATGAVKPYDLGPGLGVDHIIFNLNTAGKDGKAVLDPVKQAWFTDRRFRQAVSAAVDRKTIATTTLQGLATPLHGFVSPANRAWADPNLPKIDHDLKRAEQLLTEAGFVKRGTAEAPELFDAKNNRVEFSLIYPAENEPRKLMAAVIQEDLAKLGIKMNVVPVEQTAVSRAANETYEYEALLFGLTVSGIEPTTYANFLLSNAATHQWQPKQKTPATEWEAKIDKLFGDQAGEPDLQKRAQIFNEIQKIMAEESPVVPVVSRHIVAAVNTRVGNYAPSSIFPYSIWNAEELFIKQ
ncbi:MAG TPA: ABC transporter substrate-binding protein [Pyrinomonadaceae bacterium]|nr:ABC transporter substrate-binding protein [Pyrinomonadaceae bacterium]